MQTEVDKGFRFSTREEIEAWLISDHLERQAELIECHVKGQFNFIIPDISEEHPAIYLVTPNKEKFGFAMAVYTTSHENPNIQGTISVENGELDCAFENPLLLIDEPPAGNHNERYEQIGKHLHSYISQLSPAFEKTPILVFRSLDEFRKELPLFRIRYNGQQLTVSRNSMTVPV